MQFNTLQYVSTKKNEKQKTRQSNKNFFHPNFFKSLYFVPYFVLYSNTPSKTHFTTFLHHNFGTSVENIRSPTQLHHSNYTKKQNHQISVLKSNEIIRIAPILPLTFQI